jgi:hypothetical protein
MMMKFRVISVSFCLLPSEQEVSHTVIHNNRTTNEYERETVNGLFLLVLSAAT